MGRIRQELGKANITFLETSSLPNNMSIGRISAVRALTGEIYVQTKEGSELRVLLGHDSPIRPLIRKGSFVGYEKHKNSGVGETVITLDHLLYPKQVQILKSKGLWPKEFMEDGCISDVDTEDLSSSDSEDGDHPRGRASSQLSQKKTSAEDAGGSKKVDGADGSAEQMDEHAGDEQAEDEEEPQEEEHEEEEQEEQEEQEEEEQDEHEEEEEHEEDVEDILRVAAHFGGDYDPQEFE